MAINEMIAGWCGGVWVARDGFCVLLCSVRNEE